MIISNFRNFLEDESGAYTIWSLVWFSLYVGLGGMAVDMTDAYRTKMLLQSTADASALAAVISLPDVADGRAQAVAYSKDNMFQEYHGTVLRGSDVTFGNWDKNTGSFLTGGPEPDAAMVLTRRSRENENMLATNFLKIWGLAAWDVNTMAIAVKFLPECLTHNGLVAGNKVDVTSNNGFSDICIHGENLVDDPGHNYAIDLGNGNVYHPGVQVSMPDLNDLNGRPNVCTNNTGLCDPGTLVEGNLQPADAKEQTLAGIIDALRDTDGSGVPDMVKRGVDGDGNPVINTITYHEGLTKDYKGPFEPYNAYIYDSATCPSNQIVQLDDDTPIENVVIVADCRISASSGVTLNNSVIASTSVAQGGENATQNSINFASNTTIGGSGFCSATDDSDQVHMYSMDSIHVSAGPTVYGLRIVAVNNIQLTANNDVAGISAQAGNDIIATANGEFRFCGGKFNPDLFTYHHRLVR